MPVWLIPMLYTVASARDSSGTIRVGFPVPTWQDYLALSFDEIRQFGAASVQVAGGCERRWSASPTPRAQRTGAKRCCSISII